MIDSIFNELYPNLAVMRKACFRVMRGTETIENIFLSEEENETLRMLSDKWIKEFDKYKNNLIDNISSELDEL